MEDPTYAGYLHLDEILGAQHPVVPDSQGPAVRAAEHFFIVTHQAFELWFKQLLLDLYLGAASGSESSQFREVQRALGLRGHGGSPVYTAFLLALDAGGLSLVDTYRNPSAAGALYRVAEALVDISEEFWQLCAVHVQIAERTIGQRPGTGGTTGVSYLAEVLEGAKAFPELWGVRTRL